MAHYVMDCFDCPEAGASPVCPDSRPIKAANELDAVGEAKRIALWRKPVFFRVREVHKKGDRVIYKSTEVPHA